MSNEEIKSNKPEYETGYGKPPVVHQFKKGQSGNPKGRPRSNGLRRSIAFRVLNEMHRIEGKRPGERKHFSFLEIVIMSIKAKAISGHMAATNLYSYVQDKFGTQEQPNQSIGYIIVPERLTAEEWEAKYSPKEPVGYADGNVGQSS